jgi:hypothetical protein
VLIGNAITKRTKSYLVLTLIVVMVTSINMSMPCGAPVAISYQPLSVQQPLIDVSSAVSNKTESAHHFSLKNSTIKFLPDLSESKKIPHWNVTVWIEVSPQKLSEIDYVIYYVIEVPSGKIKLSAS